jgi:hypothetical protein
VTFVPRPDPADGLVDHGPRPAGGDDEIGLQCARFAYDELRLTTWHVVESEVGDRVITRCGREMVRTLKRGHLEFAELAEPLCKQCQRKGETT